LTGRDCDGVGAQVDTELIGRQIVALVLRLKNAISNHSGELVIKFEQAWELELPLAALFERYVAVDIKGYLLVCTDAPDIVATSVPEHRHLSVA